MFTTHDAPLQKLSPQNDSSPTDTVSSVSSVTTITEVFSSLYDPVDTELIASITRRLYELEETPSSIYDGSRIHGPYVPKDYLCKSICLSVLRRCCEQLCIMLNVDRPKVTKEAVQPLEYIPISERYKLTEKNYADFVIGAGYNEADKFKKEIGQLVHVLEHAWYEYNIFASSTCLSSFVEAYHKMKEEEDALFADVEMKKSHIRNLLKGLSSDRHLLEEKFETMEYAIKEIARSFTDVMEHSKAEKRYLRKWEGSRLEQNTLVLRNKEATYENVILGSLHNMQYEEVCHDNIKLYYEQSREDLTSEIEKWMTFYDKEFEEREMKNFQMKHSINVMISSKEKLQKQYDRRQKEIDDWLEYKRIKKEREERIVLENKATTKIQAWWRGVMFRKKLGPYKKKGKKGKQRKKKVGKKGQQKRKVKK